MDFVPRPQMNLQAISFDRLGISIKLLTLANNVDAMSPLSKETKEQFYCHHESFLRKVFTSEPEVAKRYRHDLHAVQLCFPVVQDEFMLTIMAAWFNVLCITDDIAEKMVPSVVRNVFNIGIQQLQGKQVQPLSGIDNDDRQEVILKVLCALQDQVNSLLPSKYAARFLKSVVCYLQGQIEEAQVRHECICLKDYFKIRAATIGIKPFFDILACINAQLPTKQAVLYELEGMIINTTILQNDMVGLEKDIRSGEYMNAIILSSRLSYGPTPQHLSHIMLKSTEALVQQHNTWMVSAVEKYHAATETLNSNERIIAKSILSFGRCHLNWAISSERYQK